MRDQKTIQVYKANVPISLLNKLALFNLRSFTSSTFQVVRHEVSTTPLKSLRARLLECMYQPTDAKPHEEVVEQKRGGKRKRPADDDDDNNDDNCGEGLSEKSSCSDPSTNKQQL